MTTPESPATLPLRLISWNLRYDGWTEARRAAIHELLEREQPDVLCLQEIPAESLAEGGPQRADEVAELLGMELRVAPAPHRLHTAVAYRSGWEELAWDDRYGADTWHGTGAVTVQGPGWPVPLTVISAHLIPHSTQRAVPEAQLLVTRAHRQGCPAVIAGDINHPPLVGPEPDWAQVPEHNRSSRTILDPDRPDELRGDRRVGLVLSRGGLTDAAALQHERTGQEALLAPTGHYGRLRVDQAWVSDRLVDAVVECRRLELERGADGAPLASDHHPIRLDLDLARLGDTAVREWH